MNARQNNKTQIIVGILALAGVLGAALISNADKWFSKGQSEVSTASNEHKSLSGDYKYGRAGTAKVTQTGNDVSMLLTWHPDPVEGPHYEVQGKLIGDSIVGRWRFVKTDQWFGFSAKVLDSGNSISFSGSEEPSGARFAETLLQRN